MFRWSFPDRGWPTRTGNVGSRALREVRSHRSRASDAVAHSHNKVASSDARGYAFEAGAQGLKGGVAFWLALAPVLQQTAARCVCSTGASKTGGQAGLSPLFDVVSPGARPSGFWKLAGLILETLGSRGQENPTLLYVPLSDVLPRFPPNCLVCATAGNPSTTSLHPTRHPADTRSTGELQRLEQTRVNTYRCKQHVFCLLRFPPSKPLAKQHSYTCCTAP